MASWNIFGNLMSLAFHFSLFPFHSVMAETLYRKYRPTRFADVAEQTHVLRTIQNQLAAGTLAHAYLFSGPRGVGKTTIARLLAKAANCTGRKAGDSEPCNACDMCMAFAEGRSMDTVEMDAASNTGVDNVRDNVIDNVRFMPQQGKYKVFIIDEVHMLSSAAFNALLKTLEEPPAHALFILATTELHKIPATIVSRCQRFDFHRIPSAEMTVRLRTIAKAEGVTVDDDVLAAIARLSEGCLRDAESLLGQVFAVGGEKITAKDVAGVLPQTNIALCVALVDALAAGGLSTALKALNTFVDDGGAVRYVQDELVEYLRAVMFAALGSLDATVYDAKTNDAIAAVAKTLGAQRSRQLLDLVMTARTRPSLALLPQLPLEIAFVEFGDKDFPPLGGGIKGGVSPLPAMSAPLTPPPTPPRKGGVLGRSASAASEPRRTFGNGNGVAVPVNASVAAMFTFTVDELADKWERCCAHVAERNVALPLIMRNARPVLVEGNVVTLAFPYDFHADTFRIKNVRFVEDAIAEILLERPFIKPLCRLRRRTTPRPCLRARSAVQ